MTDIGQIEAIIEAQTIYRGVSFPTANYIDEVNQAPPRFWINRPHNGISNGVDRSLTFDVILEHTTQALLETMINACLQMSTRNPSGYRLSTSNYPFHISVIRSGDDTFENTDRFLAEIQITATWSI